jgi:hypothetical protein
MSTASFNDQVTVGQFELDVLLILAGQFGTK